MWTNTTNNSLTMEISTYADTRTLTHTPAPQMSLQVPSELYPRDCNQLLKPKFNFYCKIHPDMTDKSNASVC